MFDQECYSKSHDKQVPTPTLNKLVDIFGGGGGRYIKIDQLCVE